jgi:hypothetical protein
MDNMQELTEDMLANMLDEIRNLDYQAGRIEEMVGTLQQHTGVYVQLFDALNALESLQTDMAKPRLDSQASDHNAYMVMSLLGLAAFIAVLCLISRRLNRGIAFALVMVFSQAVLFNILADRA